MSRTVTAWGLWLLFLISLSAFGQDQQAQPNSQPAAPATPAMRIRIAGNVEQAKLTRQVQPEYPQVAKAAHVSGTVVLHTVIAKDGSVRMLQFVSGPPLLMRAAMEAVKQWKYKPTLLNGQPVEVDTTISVIFTLGDQAAPDKDQSIDPQFRSDMLRFLELTHTKDSMDQVGKQVFVSLKPALTASLPGPPHRDEIVDAFETKLIEVMKSDDFTNKIVAVYSRHLTDDDIKAAIQFYSTPAGQHMIAESGKAETEMIAVGQAEGAGALPEIFKELCDRYPELQAAGKICKELPLKESIILGNRILLTSSPNFARPE